MSLWRAIVGGFGFTLGARAADAALAEADEALEESEKREIARKEEDKRSLEAREKQAKERAKARAAAVKESAKEVERELAAMKKRLAQDKNKNESFAGIAEVRGVSFRRAVASWSALRCSYSRRRRQRGGR